MRMNFSSFAALFGLFSLHLPNYSTSYQVSLPTTATIVKRPTFVLVSRNDQQSSNTDANSPLADTLVERESPLSDVDSRVLRAMLQEKKLDLDTKEDVMKLLQRGTVKTVERPSVVKTVPDESVFSSTTIKTLADTKLWRKFSTQASNFLESVQIWVTNKIESDVKVMAALSLFAWERAVRDTARALPAASTSTNRRSRQTTIFLLSNSSSFVDMESTAAAEADRDTRRVLEELGRPSDEVRAVLRSVLDILSGDPTSTAASTARSVAVRSVRDRGLRTAAPAGAVNAAERRQRAYQQRKKIKKQEKNVLQRAPMALIDTAYELKRELRAETSQPGYKTKPILNAIEAGLTETKNLLKSVRDEARLSAARKAELRLKQATVVTTADDFNVTVVAAIVDGGEEPRSQLNESTSSWSATNEMADNDNVDENINDIEEQDIENQNHERYNLLSEERSRIIQRLQLSIQEPQNTWLNPQLLGTTNLPFVYKDDSTTFKPQFDQEQLREVITKMILVRDKLQAHTFEQDEDNAELLMEDLLADLRTARTSIEEIYNLATEAVSFDVAKVLKNYLFGFSQSFNEDGDVAVDQPVLLRLEEIEKSIRSDAEDYVQNPPFMQNQWFATVVTETEIDEPETHSEQQLKRKTLEVFTPDIVDVIPDVVVIKIDDFDHHHTVAFVDTDTESLGAGLIAEIISDEDFDVAVGQTRVSVVDASLENDEVNNKMENIVAIATLRSLDVLFFVLEKTVTVTVPTAISLGKTASERLIDLQISGKGTSGWKQVRNAANPRSRY